MLLGLDCDCFLAPELFAFLQNKCLQPQADAEKCDVFSLGLVALHMVALSEDLACYNYDNFTLNWERISQVFAECESCSNNSEKVYSQELLSLIKAMMEPNPDKRLSL